MDEQTRRQKTVRRMVQVLVTTVLQGLVLFSAAGKLRWGWGWGYIGFYLLMILVNASLLRRINPDVIAERADNAGMKDWDKLVGGVFALAYFIGLPLVAGFDLRWGWTSDLHVGMHLIGVGLFLAGSVLFVWSMAVNAYFATIVRVGENETHHVIMSGPYRFIRHPGYLGAILQCLGTPLILGSWWAMIPGVVALGAILARTVLEDQTLQAELVGYDRLVQQTPYRLLPGIW